MAPTTLLQTYLAIGVANGISVVVTTEIVRPPDVLAVPLRRRIRSDATVLALGTLRWSLAPLGDRIGGS